MKKYQITSINYVTNKTLYSLVKTSDILFDQGKEKAEKQVLLAASNLVRKILHTNQRATLVCLDGGETVKVIFVNDAPDGTTKHLEFHFNEGIAIER
jgi:hypothetical protein